MRRVEGFASACFDELCVRKCQLLRQCSSRSARTEIERDVEAIGSRGWVDEEKHEHGKRGACSA